jgi:hypothetical protein
MFERYTERARRVIFFGRYEASQFGSTTIETEHLLLGLLREDKNLANRFVGEHVSAEQIRQEAQVRIPTREKVATSIDLPLSAECKRILAYAAEEAERLAHRHIGTEHLFLGILREQNCGAAQILNGHGLQLDTIREELTKHGLAPDPEGGIIGGTLRTAISALRPFFGRSPVLPAGGVVPDAETARKIAEAVWLPLYNAETIAGQMPLQVELKHNVWVVSGSAAEDSALFAFILQMNGQILSVGRGKAQ